MRIKKFYCPYCGQFRSSFQVFDYYSTIPNQNLRCKYCHRNVIQTEPKFKEFLEQLQQGEQ